MENNWSDEGDRERGDTKLIDDITTDQNSDKEDRGMNNDDGDDNSGAKDDERREEVVSANAGPEKEKTMAKMDTRNKGKRKTKK